MSGRRIADVLEARGLLDADRVARALQEQERLGMTLGQLLTERGWVPDLSYAEVVSELSGWPRLDLARVEVDPELAPTAGQGFCERASVLPLSRDRRALVVAVVEPDDEEALQQLRFRFGRQVAPRVATRRELGLLLRHVFGGDPLPRGPGGPPDTLDVEREVEALIQENRQAARALRALYELCVEKGILDADALTRRLDPDAERG